jgi:hypothetical protein
VDLAGRLLNVGPLDAAKWIAGELGIADLPRRTVDSAAMRERERQRERKMAFLAAEDRLRDRLSAAHRLYLDAEIRLSPENMGGRVTDGWCRYSDRRLYTEYLLDCLSGQFGDAVRVEAVLDFKDGGRCG